MNEKPGDFFLGIIGFFGILLPGAILLFLQLDRVDGLFEETLKAYTGRDTVSWIAFVVGSYLLGHVMQALGYSAERARGSLLTWQQKQVSEKEKKRKEEQKEKGEEEEKSKKSRIPYFLKNEILYNQAMQHMVKKGLRFGEDLTLAKTFHRAFSFIRLESPQAATEIERSTAHYKLFRSLTFVFLFDALLCLFFSCERLDLLFPRSLISFVLAIFSFFLFWWRRGWTERLAFEFYLLKTKDASEKKK